MIIPLTVPPSFETEFLLVHHAQHAFWFAAISGPDGALLGLCDFFRGLSRNFLYVWMSHFHQAPSQE